MARSGGRVDGGFSVGDQYRGPASSVMQSCDRALATADLAALTTAQLYMIGVPLPAGALVTTVTFVSGATPLAAGNNQWAALFTPSRVQVAISADATNGAWAANTAKGFTMTTPYTTLIGGLFYVGLLVKATVPSLRGAVAGNTVINNVPPILCGTADGSLTNPASCPATAAAITVTGNLPWVYIT